MYFYTVFTVFVYLCVSILFNSIPFLFPFPLLQSLAKTVWSINGDACVLTRDERGKVTKTKLEENVGKRKSGELLFMLKQTDPVNYHMTRIPGRSLAVWSAHFSYHPLSVNPSILLFFVLSLPACSHVPDVPKNQCGQPVGLCGWDYRTCWHGSGQQTHWWW